MLGKVNPTQAEVVIMVAAQVIDNDTTIAIAGASGNFELHVGKPVIAYHFLQSIRLSADAGDMFTQHGVSGIEPHRTRIVDHLGASLMLVTALAPHIGYDHAAKLARKAFDLGRLRMQREHPSRGSI
jgi:fumarate hydratase class II